LPRGVPAILIGLQAGADLTGDLTRAVADEAPGRLGVGGPWPPLQEILGRDDVVTPWSQRRLIQTS